MESIAEIPERLRREYQHYLIGRGRYGLPEIAPTTRLIRLKNVAHQGHRANRLEIWFFDAAIRCETYSIVLQEDAWAPTQKPSRHFREAVELIRSYVGHIKPDVEFVDMSSAEDRRKLRK